LNLHDEKSIKKIIDGCLRNNRKHQQELFKAAGTTLMGVCIRYAKDKSEAEDFFQDGFIGIFNNLHQYEFKGSFEGWLRRVMTNCCINQIRKNKSFFLKFTENMEFQDFEEEENTKEEFEVIRNSKIEKIIQEVQKLPPQFRTCFNMFVVDGYQHKEIAEELGIAEGTSKSNVHKAKQKIIKNLMVN